MHADLLKSETLKKENTPCSEYYVGIDVGGTEIKYGVVLKSGELVEVFKAPTQKESTETLLSQLINVCRDITEKYNILGVGVGLPCCINHKTGIADVCANLPLTGVNVKKHLSEALNIPVTVDNDANCAAWGEHLLGAGKGKSSCVLLTLGTGVGGGVISDGRLHHGHNGYAGELGHIILHPDGEICSCGQRGCLERYASVSALCRLAEKEASSCPNSILATCIKEESSGKTVLSAVKKDCPAAKKVLDMWLSQLKTGIINIYRLNDPEIIVLGGGIIAQSELFMPQLQAMCKNIKLCPAALGNTAGLIGAALLAMEADK